MLHESRFPILTEDALKKLLERQIMPLVRLALDGSGKYWQAFLPNGMLFVPPPHNPHESYLEATLAKGSPTPAPIRDLFAFAVIRSFHAQHSTFQPTVAEVLTAIHYSDVEKTTGTVLAFETLHLFPQPTDGEVFVATTILYGHKTKTA